MEIRVLKYFLTVAREESITKGAEILNITQPTLSRQLMQLEDELGVQLFIRGKNKITLTDDGMLLRRRAEEIVDLVHFVLIFKKPALRILFGSVDEDVMKAAIIYFIISGLSSLALLHCSVQLKLQQMESPTV